MAARPAAGWPAMWRLRAWGHSTGPAWRAGRASADPELQFLGRGQAHVDDLDPGPERPPGQRMVAVDRDRVRIDRRHPHVERAALGLRLQPRPDLRPGPAIQHAPRPALTQAVVALAAPLHGRHTAG